jgi:hypothetical protein
VIDKARRWEKLRDVPLNERQRLVINRLFQGFEGKLAPKWAAPTKNSNGLRCGSSSSWCSVDSRPHSGWRPEHQLLTG